MKDKIDQVFSLTTGQVNKPQPTDESGCLFGKILLNLQAFCGMTYGGAICYFTNSESKFKRYLLVLYELIVTLFMVIFYELYFNENDDMFKMNVKKPVMKMMNRFVAESHVLVFFLFKIVLAINGHAILNTIAGFKGKQSIIESKVITNVFYHFIT